MEQKQARFVQENFGMMLSNIRYMLGEISFFHRMRVSNEFLTEFRGILDNFSSVIQNQMESSEVDATILLDEFGKLDNFIKKVGNMEFFNSQATLVALMCKSKNNMFRAFANLKVL